MYKINVKFNIVTPLFLYGSDNKIPEIRLSSIKGLIRYWWRAGNAHLNLKQLKSKENMIFGGKSDNLEKSKKSNVKMRLLEKNINIKKFDDKNKSAGLKYLLYPFFFGTEKSYIEANGYFVVQFIFRDPNYIEDVIESLLFLQFFGGIGSRSRRGAGNVMLEFSEEENFDFKYENLFNTNEISTKENLIDRYKGISNLICDKTEKEYTTVIKGSEIFVFDYKNNWKEALQFIGKEFKVFRDKNKGRIYEAANFGLPIMHTNKTKIIAGKRKKNDDIEEIGRRSSPFIFKVVKCNDKFFPVIIHLNGRFLPDDYKIMKATTKKQHFKENSEERNNNIIEKFKNYLKEKKLKNIKL